MDWAARGLEYLHEAATLRIFLHRNIKSTNILDVKVQRKGMVKHLMNEDPASCSSSPTRMLRTFRYFAYEYAIVGKAKLQFDVISFGVVLMELMSVIVK